jgi:hypothetical protein
MKFILFLGTIVHFHWAHGEALTQDQMLLQVETQTEIVLKILRVYNVTTIPSRQDLLSANNSLYFTKSFKSRTYESAWRRTRLTILKSKRGFRSWLAKSDLVCQARQTTAPFLALFTAPHRLHHERRHFDTALSGAAFDRPYPLCHLHNSRLSGADTTASVLVVSRKKSRVKQPFNFHVDLPPCQHRPSP